MINLILIHGAYGNPNENWFPWLKKELEKLDHKIYTPKFPTPQGQSLDNWEKVFANYEKYINKDTILIGHSLGVTFLLTVLEKLDVKVKASYFVAGFVNKLNNPEFDNINRTFIEKDFCWVKIKANCENFYIFHSDNDPYVLLSEGKLIANKLNTDLTLIEDAGHFNSKAGYDKFEKLLEKVKKDLS